jgi:hypothetical protein
MLDQQPVRLAHIFGVQRLDTQYLRTGALHGESACA